MCFLAEGFGEWTSIDDAQSSDHLFAEFLLARV